MRSRHDLEKLLLCALLALAGCSRRDGNTVFAQAEAAEGPPAPPAAPTARVATPPRAPVDEAEDGQRGQKRWRDTGVYVDGKPVGVLAFGELPISLKPVWITERVSAPIEPGSPGLGYRIVKQRHYRFTDYLRAVGVDLAKVKEIHVYGPRHSDSVVATGAELRRKGQSFLFRFGTDVGGKAIPVVPHDFGNRRSPDKISAVMVYVTKRPPTLVWNQGFALDGKLIEDVPYYGMPLRGGVRVYQDDRLAMSIKRPLLRGIVPFAKAADGTPSWKLTDVLAQSGVRLDRVAEAWVIRDERRAERLSRAQLDGLTFTMAERGQNQLRLGDQQLVVQALALHARALRPAELPQILPDEEF